MHTLQEAVIPKDLDMFERYWIDQFADLLNVAGNRIGKKDSDVAAEIKRVLRAQLDQSRTAPV